MKALDTNVLARLLTRDDAAQVKKAESFVKQGAWVSTLVLTECIWVLEAAYGLKKVQIITVVEMLLNHANLVLQDVDMIEEALDAYRNSKKVGFSDHLILATAHKAGHKPLGSFDRALARLEGVEEL